MAQLLSVWRMIIEGWKIIGIMIGVGITIGPALGCSTINPMTWNDQYETSWVLLLEGEITVQK